MPLHHPLRGRSPSPNKLGEDEFAACASRLAGFAGAVLGWSPDQFWRATPAEVAAVVGVLVGETTAPPEREAIARLMEAFPDG